jgi:serine/threonine protein kinase
MTEDLSTLDNGRYQLQEILGQGGMAIVYKAWDERLRVERAIKILSPRVARRQSLRKRF